LSCYSLTVYLKLELCIIMNINNCCVSRFSFLISLVCIGIGGSTARGHSDVFVVNVGGKVTIGGANELGTIDENFDLTTKVFEGVMITNFPPIGPADYGRDEPGVHALSASSAAFPTGTAALPGGAAVSIGLPEFQVGGATAAVFFWDGIGEVNFVPLFETQPNAQLTIDPSPIGNVGANGAADLHPAFKLDVSGPSIPNDGVYLIAPTILVAGLEESDRFYMLFLADALLDGEEAAEELEEAFELGQTVVHGKDFAFFEEAVEFVEQLAVPEPSSLGLAGLAVLWSGGRRMRRRGFDQ
jgi:hypothetical protein